MMGKMTEWSGVVKSIFIEANISIAVFHMQNKLILFMEEYTS